MDLRQKAFNCFFFFFYIKIRLHLLSFQSQPRRDGTEKHKQLSKMFSSLKIEQTHKHNKHTYQYVRTRTYSMHKHTHVHRILPTITTYISQQVELKWTGSDQTQQRSHLCKPASLQCAALCSVFPCICVCVCVRP